MRKMIDLTYPIEEGMLTFPAHWHVPVEISILGRHSVEGRETRKVKFSTHTGTHIDAPLHFIPGGKTITDIPLEKLIGKAQLIDVSHVKGKVELKDIEELVDRDIKKIVFRFGWGKYWNTLQFYKDWPYFSKEAIEFLVYDVGIDMIGMDIPSPDDPNKGFGSKEDSPNHKILLSNEVVICEYMANLEQLEVNKFELIILPLKIEGSDGAPARCVAIY
jgi:arylformamidase